MIMAKTLIGNVKGNDGRGISKIEKTATTGDVDTYTITYTDSTTSTYDVRNGDTIAIQRQIVPSAEIESSTTATQPYGVGDYLILNGVLRKVTAAIASGNQITDSNSKATTVASELVGTGAVKYLGSGTANVFGCTVTVEAYAVGKVVSIYVTDTSGYMASSGTVSESCITSLTLPAGYRPMSTVNIDTHVDFAWLKTEGFLISDSGTVSIYVTSGKALAGFGFEKTACTFVAKK